MHITCLHARVNLSQQRDAEILLINSSYTERFDYGFFHELYPTTTYSFDSKAGLQARWLGLEKNREFVIFTALHGMQTRSYDEISVRPSVRLSVCLSVKRVHCDKTEERFV